MLIKQLIGADKAADRKCRTHRNSLRDATRKAADVLVTGTGYQMSSTVSPPEAQGAKGRGGCAARLDKTEALRSQLTVDENKSVGRRS